MNDYWNGYWNGRQEPTGGGGGIGFLIAFIAMFAFLLVGGILFMVFAFPVASAIAGAAALAVGMLGETLFSDGTDAIFWAILAAVLVTFAFVFRKGIRIEEKLADRFKLLFALRHIWRLFGAGFGAYGILMPLIGPLNQRGDLGRVLGNVLFLANYAEKLFPFYAMRVIQPWLVAGDMALLGAYVAMFLTHVWLKKRWEDSNGYGYWPLAIRLPRRDASA